MSTCFPLIVSPPRQVATHKRQCAGPLRWTPPSLKQVKTRSAHSSICPVHKRGKPAIMAFRGHLLVVADAAAFPCDQLRRCQWCYLGHCTLKRFRRPRRKWVIKHFFWPITKMNRLSLTRLQKKNEIKRSQRAYAKELNRIVHQSLKQHYVIFQL